MKEASKENKRTMQDFNGEAADDNGLSLHHGWGGLVVTCVFFLIVAIITLPRFPYPGDNFVPRDETIHLAKRGELGIPYGMRGRITGLDVPRGQYFYSNDTRQRFYSKYGIGYTIAFLPPVWAELATNPTFDMDRQTETFFFKLGIYQILLGLIVVYYLYRLAWLFAKSQWICCAFTLATIFSTFLWHYLRAPTLEIYQLVAFAGACVHSLLFLRRRLKGEDSTGCWMHLLAATLWSGALVLMKSSFVVLGFALSALPFFIAPDARRFWLRPFASLAKHWKAYSGSLIIPWVVIFAVLLGTSAIRFESAFNSGYMQWEDADGTPAMKFGMQYIVPNFKTFLWRLRGDFNLFKAYPYALLGLLCCISFTRRRPFDLLFIMVIVLPGVFLLLTHNKASGQWCYGPRYFLFYAMLLALPFLWWFDRLCGKVPKSLKSLLVFSCLVPVLYLAWMQLMVNGVHYFVSYQMGGIFESTQHPALIAFGKKPRAPFCRDLFYYGQGWSNYYPLEVVRPLIPPAQQAEWLNFKATMDYFARPNFYFFPGPDAKAK